MPRLLINAKARSDIERIASYIAQDHVRAAIRFILAAKAAFEKLAESAEKIKHSTTASKTAPNARLSSPPTAPSLPLSAPTLLGCAPACWLWQAVSGQRRYFRK